MTCPRTLYVRLVCKMFSISDKSQELRETVEILEMKMAKLEQLVRLKDSKIQRCVTRDIYFLRGAPPPTFVLLWRRLQEELGRLQLAGRGGAAQEGGLERS
jgi:hypothetical protein